MKTKICTYTECYRHGLMTVLVLLGVAMGLWQEIITPTLPNLKGKLNVSYEVIGLMMSMRSMGNILVLFLAGYVFDTYPYLVTYIMFTGCFVAGVCTIIIPWCYQVWMVALFFILQSAAQNVMNNGGQLIILQTFKEKAIGKMQIYHLGYGIGGLLSGLISAPFLPKNLSPKVKITRYCKQKLNISEIENGSMPQFSNTTETLDRDSRYSFEYIYLIAGLVAIVISLIYLSFQSLRNPCESGNKIKKKESWLQKINPKYTANGKFGFGLAMTVLLFMYYFFYSFGLLNFLPFIVVYAIDPCKEYVMDQSTAAYLHSVVNGFFLLGRIVGSFVLDLNPTVMILIFNFSNLIFILVLIFFSNKYALALWIGACGMRFCNSVVYPTGTSYVNRYIIVTSSLISVAFTGDTAGVITSRFVGGYVIDNYPSYYILFACFGSMVLLFVITAILAILGRINGERDLSKKKIECKTEEVELNK